MRSCMPQKEERKKNGICDGKKKLYKRYIKIERSENRCFLFELVTLVFIETRIRRSFDLKKVNLIVTHEPILI